MAALLGGDRQLSEELLSLRVYALLAGWELRRASQSCCRWHRGLRAAPRVVQERARWQWRWSRASSGALIHGDNPCAVRGGGGWHPGAVAIADLRLTADSEAAWRVVLSAASPRGDLLLGITQDFGGSSEAASREAMEEGYAYIMGRNTAPASMFYGGRSLRCCFSAGDSSGPRIDYVQENGRLVDACLSRLRHVGDWVEFHLSAGVLSALDFKGHTFVWSGRLQAGTTWYPTLAWTGSSAVLCLAYPEHFAKRRPLQGPGGA